MSHSRLVLVLPSNFVSIASKVGVYWGARVAQSVKSSTSAQVAISPFVGSSSASGSVLTSRSLEPASDSVSPLSAPPPLVLSLSLSKINKCKKKKICIIYHSKSITFPSHLRR